MRLRYSMSIAAMLALSAAPSAWAALALDNTFDTDGIALLNIASDLDGARDVAIQTDGKIVLAGMSRQGSGSAFDYLAVGRLNSDGSVDTTFGTAGSVVTLPAGTSAFGGADGRAVAIQTDGKIVVAGYYNQNTGNGKQLLVARYLATGVLDTTFGTNGVAIFTTADQREASSVAIQTDGKIVVAGLSQPSGMSPAGLIVRLNSDGSLDTTFATGGVFTSAVTGSSFNDIRILTSGKLLAVGTNSDLLLTQLTAAGALDTSFDGDGVVTRNVSTYLISGVSANTDDWLEALVILSDGKIAVAGGYRPGATGGVFRAVVARFTAAGALDTTYGASGFVTLPAGVDDKYLYDIVARSNDEVVIAGLGLDGAQISADGTATSTLSASTGIQAILGLAVQSDGKIVGAGEKNISGANYQLAAIRLSATNLTGGPPADTTPDAFTFVDASNVTLSTVTVSATVTIAGISSAASVSVTGGEYSVGCTATFTAAAGTVSQGQTICVRHTSSATNSTAVNTVLTVGGVSDTFTSTTMAAVTDPPPAGGGGGALSWWMVAMLAALASLKTLVRPRAARE
jgi:uncharacterized delta-60 repeat protein